MICTSRAGVLRGCSSAGLEIKLGSSIGKGKSGVKTWVTEFSATTQRERCKGHCPQDVKEDGW